MSTATIPAPAPPIAADDLPAAQPPKSAFQKRIDALIRDKHEAEREAERLKTELVTLTKALRKAIELAERFKRSAKAPRVIPVPTVAAEAIRRVGLPVVTRFLDEHPEVVSELLENTGDGVYLAGRIGQIVMELRK